MKKVCVKIPLGDSISIGRAAYEMGAVKSNLIFLMNKHQQDADYLLSEEYENVLELLYEKMIMYEEICHIIMSDLLGCDTFLVEQTDLQTSTVTVSIPNDLEIPCELEGNNKLEFHLQNYNDMIASFYKNELDDTHAADAAKTVIFQVTDNCNLNCSYCYQKSKGHRKMTFETAKAIIDKLLTDDTSTKDFMSSNNSIALIVEFIGGEPFLEVDLIDKICDYFQTRLNELQHPWLYRYIYSISSNGTLYTEPAVQKFLQKHYLDLSFSVTVDGTKKLHDACRLFKDGSPSYDLAHFAATDWMRRGYLMGSKITLAPQNVRYFNECLQQMIRDGFIEINANTVYEDVWSIADARTLFEQCKAFTQYILDHPDIDTNSLEISYLTNYMVGYPLSPDDDHNWCGGTGTMLAIDPDGDLYPCIRYMESSISKNQKPYIIGNVDDGIGTCSEECDRLQCLKCASRSTQSEEQCVNCPIAGGCGWCSGYNYECFGTVNKRTTFTCDMHKSRVLSIVHYHNTLYKNGRTKYPCNLWCPKEWAIPIIGAQQYDELVELTKACGMYVNTSTSIDKTMREQLIQEYGMRIFISGTERDIYETRN